MNHRRILYWLTALAALLLAPGVQARDLTLLNVSYDPTRELYREEDAAHKDDNTLGT